MLIITKDSQGNSRDKGIPETCGDCHHCAKVDIFLPKLHALAKMKNENFNGWYTAFRCQHHDGRDWKGARTAVDPNAAPPEDFCPMLRGIAKNKSVIYAK